MQIERIRARHSMAHFREHLCQNKGNYLDASQQCQNYSLEILDAHALLCSKRNAFASLSFSLSPLSSPFRLQLKATTSHTILSAQRRLSSGFVCVAFPIISLNVLEYKIVRLCQRSKVLFLGTRRRETKKWTVENSKRESKKCNFFLCSFPFESMLFLHIYFVPSTEYCRSLFARAPSSFHSSLPPFCAHFAGLALQWCGYHRSKFERPLCFSILIAYKSLREHLHI